MQLSQVNCAYGAPMGRASKRGDNEASVKLNLIHVALDSGGYDKGGAYWGLRFPVLRENVPCRPIGHPEDAPPVLRSFRQTPKIYAFENKAAGIFGTVEAFDREDAKAQIREDYPQAKFYR